MNGKNGLKRLTTEYMKMIKTPVEFVEAHPLEDNLFEWYYVLRPVQEPYKNGVYYGKLIFPSEYPMKPPEIFMITPNGRFQPNTKLCLSMSSFHPESWSPLWNIPTILIGVMSFMYEESRAIGSIKNTIAQKKIYATNSLDFNTSIPIFKELFILEKIHVNDNTPNDKKENITQHITD
jgi:ubiquitin-conjugating enzyme E2 J2